MRTVHGIAPGIALVAALHAVACGGPATGKPHDDDNGGDPAPRAPALTWSVVTSLPSSGGGSYASGALLDGKLFVLNSDYFTPANTLDVYDVAAGAWSTGPDMPGHERMQPVVLAAAGKVWVIGGYLGDTAERVPDLVAFDPQSSTWEQRASMNEGRHEHMGAALGDKLYVFGGWDGRSPFYSNRAEVYDVASDTWSPIAKLPHARKGGVAVVVDRKIFLVGGIDSDDYLRIVDVYDPAAGAWSTADFALREPRFALAAAAVGARIVVTGGSFYGGPDVGDQYSSTVEIVDPAESWSSYTDDLDVALIDGVGVGVDDTSAFVIGAHTLRRVSL